MADSLRMLLRPSDVIAPDVPIEPDEALRLLHNICESERPELELHYPSRAIYYPGGHLPAYPELKAWLPSALMLFQSAAESEADA